MEETSVFAIVIAVHLFLGFRVALATDNEKKADTRVSLNKN